MSMCLQNNQIENCRQLVPPVPHAEGWAVDTMSLDWLQTLGFALTLFALITRTIEHMPVHSEKSFTKYVFTPSDTKYLYMWMLFL